MLIINVKKKATLNSVKLIPEKWNAYLFLDRQDNLKNHLLPYPFFKVQYDVFWWQFCT